VLNPFFPNKPIIEMADGSRHQTYNHVSGNGTFITRDFWQYRSVPNPVLSLPNGVTYSFGHQATIGGLGTVLLATEVRDPFGNRVVIEYASGVNVPPDAITRITQFLGGTTRQVTFTYDGAMGRNSLRTMTLSAGGRAYTWNYVQTDAVVLGCTLLTEVRPPLGPSWRHTYNTVNYPRHEMTRLTTPSGGIIDYTYADHLFICRAWPSPSAPG
jgi:hypothetical protein